MHDTIFIVSVEHFSYLAIFFFALLAGLLLPIPEEIVLVVTGYLAKSGIVNPYLAAFICIFAFAIGDNILFKLSLRNNKYVTKLIHEVFSLKFISKRKDFLERHIGATIFVSRFMPYLRFIAPVFSGYVKASQKKFMLFNTLAISIYASFLIWVGYFFSDYLNVIVVEIGKIKHVLFILLMIALGLMISRAVDFFLNGSDSDRCKND